MLRPRLALLLAVVSALVLAVPLRAARADQPGGHALSVAVLAVDSEDAEDQADALTGALRSRVRASQGWSLIETTQSLGMLTAALKCPSKPTPECQQKIGDQIKAERYIWGTLQRGPTAGQVTAELHLYQKGKPDSQIRESYADNLKDQNDDTLRKIAQRMIDRLGGGAVGVIVVRTTDHAGEVVVDGEKRVPITGGTARIELAPGPHSIEVAGPSGSTKRTVLVTAGKETPVDIGPTPPSGSDAPDKPFPTKTVVGSVALGGGLILGAVSVQQLLLYLDFKDRGRELGETKFPGKDPCPKENTSQEYCDLDSKAKVASGISIAAAAVGAAAIGVGVYFLFIDAGAPGAKSTGAARRPRVVPTLGKGSGGLTLSGEF